MTASTMFHPQTRTGQILAWAWDMIDISDNIARAQDWIETIDNGLMSLLLFGVFVLLTIFGAALTWFFDIQSTIEGMSGLTNQVIPNLPTQTAHLTWWVVVAFTCAPTFLELFTAGMAKQDVKIIQVAIIAFTLFDLVTDIPRSYSLAMGMWPQIQAMGWGLGHATFWVYFLLWLGFATLGFELLTVIFGYAALVFGLKFFKSRDDILPRRRRATPAPRPRSYNRKANTRTTSHLDPDDSVIMDGNPEVVIIDG